MSPIQRSLTMPCYAACATTIVALAVSSCGDNATAPDQTGQTVAALQKVAGDEQVALPGEDVRAPLRVRVIGADGKPLAGQTVQWAVTEGQAALHPSESATDGSGVAETRVTIGATIGRVAVSAVARGASAVSFALESRNPCQTGSGPEIPNDTIVVGRLQLLDCNNAADARFHDFYRLTITTQQGLIIYLRAPSFDPLVRFFDSPETPRERGGAFDTVDVRREALMRWILPPGTYLVAATTLDVQTTGAYELSIGVTSESATLCNFKWIVPGLTTAQTLAATDCVDYSGGTFHEDAFVLGLLPGERVMLTQSSTQFSPRLRLFQRSGELIVEAGANLSGTATINFTSEKASAYFIRASSALPLQSGQYTLHVSRPAAGATTAATVHEGLNLSATTVRGVK
jgi:hypothetical protein